MEDKVQMNIVLASYDIRLRIIMIQPYIISIISIPLLYLLSVGEKKLRIISLGSSFSFETLRKALSSAFSSRNMHQISLASDLAPLGRKKGLVYIACTCAYY